ncbi:hypothetical protein [Micromonospora sp. RTP1Z1]|uniref:hypothetical protein n=1 Tax=Micromonospora sp. RTP1Z1 TaxID=2994043 RepID=UPI0029C74E21|nr:hypothetical protein [Micromonospora sp. RTP1Z1]
MITRSNPTDPAPPPPGHGVIVGAVGTLAALAGAVAIVVGWQMPRAEVGLLLGGMLLFGGLLMRIESAITRGMNRQHDAPDQGTA